MKEDTDVGWRIPGTLTIPLFPQDEAPWRREPQNCERKVSRWNKVSNVGLWNPMKDSVTLRVSK